MKKSIIIIIILINLTRGQMDGEPTFIKTTKRAIDYSKLIKLVFEVKPVLKDMYSIWNTLLRTPDVGIPGALFRSTEHEVLGRLIDISNKVSILEARLVSSEKTTVRNILQSFPEILRLQLALRDFSEITHQLTFAHKKLHEYLVLGYQSSDPTTNKRNASNILEKYVYQTNNDVFNTYKLNNSLSVEKFTLLEFITWATGSDYNSIISLLERLKESTFSSENAGIFKLVKNYFQEASSNICNLEESPHQVLYNMYNRAALSQIKGNVILQFSYMLLKIYDKGNFTVEAEIARNKFEENAIKLAEIVKTILPTADRSIYNCDPAKNIDGVTYTQLTKLLQGYIENEVNLNPYGTCSENCAYYKFTEYNGCYKEQFCSKQPQCKGRVINCRYIDSDFNICISSNPDRRYDWIEYENGRVLGNKDACDSKNFFKVDSWWRYLFWHCSYCMCFCDEIQGSDRYFNLRDVTSDVKNNKVVTGVKLVKNNHIIHLQIQQGVLGPRGMVDKSTISWKPVDNYTIEDHNVENNIDYHTMSWVERTIDTDEIFGPPEHVVTGVRFRKIGGHLNLEIRITPINFTTGIIFNSDYSYWSGNDNTDGNPKNPRTEIILTDPAIPITRSPHFLNSKHDQYFKFQASSLESDAGQSTVPFIDLQPLTSKGFALSGIGLIHRGVTGSGGFLAPKLISYDFSPHINAQEI